MEGGQRMNEKSMMSKHQGKAANMVTVLLWIYSLLTFLILLYMTYQSLRPKRDVLSKTFSVPQTLNLDNYVRLITKEHFFRYFGNSVIVLAASLALLVFLSSLTAYGIARYQFKGRNICRAFFLLGMMFPAQLGVVPIFQIMKNLGLINNPLAVILVSGANISMPVFMLTNFFEKLPKEIYEAAVIDGAGEWTAFRKIMFPMASPVIFSVCITSSVSIWNQFFLPLIFLQRDGMKTLPQLVTKYTSNIMNTMDLATAVSTLSTIPILILFFLFSNRILDGVTAGGVKG